jgi:hypothetical protein
MVKAISNATNTSETARALLRADPDTDCKVMCARLANCPLKSPLPAGIFTGSGDWGTIGMDGSAGVASGATAIGCKDPADAGIPTVKVYIGFELGVLAFSDKDMLLIAVVLLGLSIVAVLVEVASVSCVFEEALEEAIGSILVLLVDTDSAWATVLSDDASFEAGALVWAVTEPPCEA